MTGPDSADLAITGAERVDPGGPMVLVRVTGAGPAPTELTLVVDAGGPAHRIAALPGPAPAGGWGAGFAVPRELLAGADAWLALDPGDGPPVALPALREREVPRRPRAPRAVRTAPRTAALTPPRAVRRRVDALLTAPFDGFAFGDSRPETPGRWQRVVDETNRRVGLLRDALGPRRDD